MFLHRLQHGPRLDDRNTIRRIDRLNLVHALERDDDIVGSRYSTLYDARETALGDDRLPMLMADPQRAAELLRGARANQAFRLRR